MSDDSEREGSGHAAITEQKWPKRDKFAISPFIANRLESGNCSPEEVSHLEWMLTYISGGYGESPETKAKQYQELLNRFSFNHEPLLGWVGFAFDLDEILHRLSATLPQSYESAPNMAKRASLLKIRTEALRSEFLLLLNHAPDIRNLDNPADSIRGLDKMSMNLKSMAQQFGSIKMPTKWKSSRIRQVRISLAVCLAPIFEREFSFIAKPLGGSTNLDVEEENEWTRFYQAMAFDLLGESVTPDRKAILWEGHKLFRETDES